MSWQPTPFTADRAKRDPITGKIKTDVPAESIVDFAERHGWQIRRYPNESMGYLETFRFVKGLEILDLTLWTNTTTDVITSARYNAIDIPRGSNKEMRARVERVIVGMACTCEFREWPEAHVIDPKCLIHGDDSERREIADVRGIDIEQATQEQMNV